MTRDEILNLTPEQLLFEIVKRKFGDLGTDDFFRIVPNWPNDVGAALELVEEAAYYEIRKLQDQYYVGIGNKKKQRFGVDENCDFEARGGDLAITASRAWLMWKEGEK